MGGQWRFSVQSVCGQWAVGMRCTCGPSGIHHITQVFGGRAILQQHRHIGTCNVRIPPIIKHERSHRPTRRQLSEQQQQHRQQYPGIGPANALLERVTHGTTSSNTDWSRAGG